MEIFSRLWSRAPGRNKSADSMELENGAEFYGVPLIAQKTLDEWSTV
jgi:hypothetical protein